MFSLNTERLTIDHATLDDAPFMLELLNQPDFIANIGDREIRNLRQSQSYIKQNMLDSYRDNGFGMFAVRRNSDRQTLGVCGLVKRPTLDNIDIGYAFLSSSQGKGYAREAAQCVMDWAINELKLKRLIAIVQSNNTPSIRLLESLGLSFESLVQLTPNTAKISLYGWNARKD